MELILAGLAAFYVWNTLRFLLPFTLPDQVALLLYGGIAYGLIQVTYPHVLMALAAAGIVTLLMLLLTLVGVRAKPWSLPRPHLPGHYKLTGLGHRPGQRASKVGRRVPTI